MSTDGITGKRRAYENKKNLHFLITFYVLEPGFGISYIAFHLSSVKKSWKMSKTGMEKEEKGIEGERIVGGERNKGKQN